MLESDLFIKELKRKFNNVLILFKIFAIDRCNVMSVRIRLAPAATNKNIEKIHENCARVFPLTQPAYCGQVGLIL
jgi:hypothetical protein